MDPTKDKTSTFFKKSGKDRWGYKTVQNNKELHVQPQPTTLCGYISMYVDALIRTINSFVPGSKQQKFILPLFS